MPLNLGKVVVKQPNRTTVTSPSFATNTVTTFAGLTDVDAQNIQNGYTLIYSSANGKYEMKSPQELVNAIQAINGGKF
jgi:hypothetical protein